MKKSLADILREQKAQWAEEAKQPKQPIEEDTRPGAKCGIGSIVEFEYDNQKLMGKVTAFGPHGLIRIATDSNRPMFLHSVGKALIVRIIKLIDPLDDEIERKAAASVMGSSKSPAKVEAARLNGAKGGRPKKQP